MLGAQDVDTVQEVQILTANFNAESVFPKNKVVEFDPFLREDGHRSRFPAGTLVGA